MFLERITDSGGVTLYIEIFYLVIIKYYLFCATPAGVGNIQLYLFKQSWTSLKSMDLIDAGLFPEGSNFVCYEYSGNLLTQEESH
jgi:hypothetical protein